MQFYVIRRNSMNYNEQTTIAAISTAMSNSGIGIVRMTGEDSVEIADRI